jgi:uncharacterized protein (TIGR03382 family)
MIEEQEEQPVTRCAALALALLALASLPARGAGLDGDEVQVDLLTQFIGGFADPTAVVGAGVEFSRIFQTGGPGEELELSVDFAGPDIVITYRNDLLLQANIGLVGFDMTSLDPGQGLGITNLVLFGSTFPQGLLDPVSFGPHSISIGVSDIDFHMPAQTTYVATYVITTPEPVTGACAGAALMALALLRRRRD